MDHPDFFTVCGTQKDGDSATCASHEVTCPECMQGWAREHLCDKQRDILRRYRKPKPPPSQRLLAAAAWVDEEYRLRCDAMGPAAGGLYSMRNIGPLLRRMARDKMPRHWRRKK